MPLQQREWVRPKLSPAMGWLAALLAASTLFPGCGGEGASPGSSSPPPSPAVAVTVTPGSGNVLLGTTLQLSATVSGAESQAVTWSVNGISGGSSTVGTISSGGLYTAPADLLSPSSVVIRAISIAAPSASGTAAVTVTSDISVAASQAAADVELGATEGFSATLSSAGHPDTGIRWALAGSACPSQCGSVDASGNYTAPQILPSPATLTLVAQSVADPSKQATVILTITSHFTLQLSAPGAVLTSATAVVVATLTPVPGSNPSPVIHWSLSGAGCSGSACGTLASVTTQNVGTGASSSSNADAETANYTAPATAPAPNTVTIFATPLADPSKQAQVTVAIQAGISVVVSPITATLSVNHRITLAVQVNGAQNQAVTWAVNGVAGGNAASGQICVAGSSPCVSVTTASAPQVDFVAPPVAPSPNPATVEATSAADATKNGTSLITVINHDVVSVMPGAVTLAPGAVQSFSATVLGATNQNVVWQLHGAGCAISGACGIIAAGGTYTAPGTPPTPNSFQVVAISSDDTSQSGSANVVITAGAYIQSLHPASVYAGAADGFTLRVDGGGFAAGSPGPGSALLIGGAVRTTSCTSATECTAPVFASDVAAAGAITVQMQNPNGSLSNQVALVVAPPNVSNDSIALSDGAPSAAGKNITVVEPTTAGISSAGDDLDLSIAALGNFSTGTNTCTLEGNPIAIVPPASGTATNDICIFSQAGLDTSMAYTITGSGDVSVISQQPAGLGIIHLTLQINANAQPGARTLFIQNTNLDKTAASGVLEVQ